MPRVETRVARKDYPQNGIKKGDTYYYTSLKLQRGGIIKRSLRPFKRSELTTSEFKGALYDWEDAKAEITSMDDAQQFADDIRQLGEEQGEKFNNMPEGLQQGDTGQTLETRRETCEAAASEIEEIIGEWESAKSDWESEIEDYKTAKKDYEEYLRARDEWDEESGEDESEEVSEPDVPDNTLDGDEPEFDETEWLDRMKDVSVDE
jgi:type I site-specific restriction-modification system R (restriction) subunit